MFVHAFLASLAQDEEPNLERLADKQGQNRPVESASAYSRAVPSPYDNVKWRACDEGFDNWTGRQDL